MKKFEAVALILILALVSVLPGCKAGGEKIFTFEALSGEDAARAEGEQLEGSSYLLSLAADFTGEEAALIQGQLLTLFGEPLYSSMDMENAYRYVVQAEDQDGNSFLLSVYCGPSGPAVGGDPSAKGIDEAAEALQEYIGEAEPADFEYLGYYLDTASEIIQGVSQGRAYYEEELMTEEQFMRALEMLQGQ